MGIPIDSANSLISLYAPDACTPRPHIVTGLSAATSRGDQVLNAGSFEKQGYSSVLQDAELTSNNLINGVNKVYDNRRKYIEAMNNSTLNDSVGNIINLIKNI